MNSNEKIEGADLFFKQALLNPKKNDLLYVLDSCYKIVSMKDIHSLHETILNETINNLQAIKGALYLKRSGEDEYDMVHHTGISPNEIAQWGYISESVKDELKINRKSFFQITNDMKVELNTLIIPISSGGGAYAIIKLSQRAGVGKFSKQDVTTANQIIDFINIAVENAMKSSFGFDETLRLHDKRTFKLNYFHEYFTFEVMRARRYKKTFSIITVRIEDFDLIRSTFQLKTVKDFINSILDKLNITIRETDFIAEKSDCEYLIMLPETDYFGSLMTMRKVDLNVEPDLIIKEGERTFQAAIMMSSASYPKDGETEEEILRSVSTRLVDAKNSITEKFNIKKLSFQEVLKEIIGNVGDYAVYTKGVHSQNIPILHKRIQDPGGVTRFSVFHEKMMEQLESMILHETTLNSERRGNIYLGNLTLKSTFSILNDLPDFEYTKTRLFLITRQCKKESAYPNLTYIFTNDPSIIDYYFFIYLNEEYAYGIFTRKSQSGAYYGFHTSESIFIENIVAKLQKYYLPQERL